MTKTREEVQRVVFKALQDCVVLNGKVVDESTSLEAVGFDEVDTLEVILAVEDALDVSVPDDGYENCKTAKELVDLIHKHLGS